MVPRRQAGSRCRARRTARRQLQDTGSARARCVIGHPRSRQAKHDVVVQGSNALHAAVKIRVPVPEPPRRSDQDGAVATGKGPCGSPSTPFVHIADLRGLSPHRFWGAGRHRMVRRIEKDARKVPARDAKGANAGAAAGPEVDQAARHCTAGGLPPRLQFARVRAWAGWAGRARRVTQGQDLAVRIADRGLAERGPEVHSQEQIPGGQRPATSAWDAVKTLRPARIVRRGSSATPASSVRPSASA